MKSQRKGINFVGLIVGLLLLGLCLFFALPAALSNNLLFATGWVSQRPAQATIYYKGETIVLEPDEPDYDTLVEACHKTLTLENGYVGWGWSEERFEQVRANDVAVELIYDQPVKIPGSRVDIGDMYRLFYPLDVFGGGAGEVVFRGGEGRYWGNPIRVETLDMVREAVEEIVNE